VKGGARHAEGRFVHDTGVVGGVRDLVELRCSAGKVHLRRGKISVYVYYLK
jgi:hypothetical protein